MKLYTNSVYHMGLRFFFHIKDSLYVVSLALYTITNLSYDKFKNFMTLTVKLIKKRVNKMSTKGNQKERFSTKKNKT